MTEELRIKDSKEFNDIINNGRKIKNNYFSIYYKDKKMQNSRFGITLAKKFGNAVKRNYYKRIMREIIRNNLNIFSNLSDYIIIMKRDCENVNFNYLNNAFIDLIKKEKK